MYITRTYWYIEFVYRIHSPRTQIRLLAIIFGIYLEIHFATVLSLNLVCVQTVRIGDSSLAYIYNNIVLLEKVVHIIKCYEKCK